MAAFLGDIAFLAGILVIAAGLLLLHRATADPRPRLLRIAGIVLLAGGIGTATCTGYYFLKYHFAGDLDQPYPMLGAGKNGERPPMGMMPGGEPPDPEPELPENDHEAHH